MKTPGSTQNSACRLIAHAAVVLAAIAGSAAARAGQDETRQAIAVRHVDRHPTTDAAARSVLARLDRAAIEACGGSLFSLREVKDALRAGRCWRDAMAGAVAEIGDPRLADRFAHGHPEGGRHAL